MITVKDFNDMPASDRELMLITSLQVIEHFIKFLNNEKNFSSVTIIGTSAYVIHSNGKSLEAINRADFAKRVTLVTEAVNVPPVGYVPT